MGNIKRLKMCWMAPPVIRGWKVEHVWKLRFLCIWTFYDTINPFKVLFKRRCTSNINSHFLMFLYLLFCLKDIPKRFFVINTIMKFKEEEMPSKWRSKNWASQSFITFSTKTGVMSMFLSWKYDIMITNAIKISLCLNHMNFVYKVSLISY